jgi:hypothetical protein
MNDESIEPGSPGWLEQLVDHALGTAMFRVSCRLDDGWHSGDIGGFYIPYAYDQPFRELIHFCDTHKLRFEILYKDNASAFRRIVCRAPDCEKPLQAGQFSDSSLFRANNI